MWSGIARSTSVVIALALSLVWPTVGIPQAPSGSAADLGHFVPEDKGLTAEWLANLRRKGEPEIYTGKDLDAIGMPVGGIGAGQLYMRGDGTLSCWRIFNRMPDTDVGQGFAVVVEEVGKYLLKRLNRQDFPAAQFRGEYPVGIVSYRDESFPIEVRMEAYSPFIPLNASESGLPATVFDITVRNASDRPAKVGMLGWLENGVCRHSADQFVAVRESRIMREEGRTVLVHTVGRWAPDPGSVPRENVLLADFDGENYGEWKTTGDAFGDKPVGGRAPTAGTFRGTGLVDTYIPAGDGPQGTLTSPEFVISRRFIGFLVAGGAHRDLTCINLLVDGKVVRTVAGRNDERLTPCSWDVREFADKKARIEIVDRFSGGWGHINVDHIELADVPVASEIETQADYGSMALALAGSSEPTEAVRRVIASSEVLARFSAEERATWPVSERRETGIIAPLAQLEPGAERSFVFVLTWHFPNHPNGHAYAARFQNAAAVAGYVLDNYKRLAGDTRKWRDTHYDSTLPAWLLDRLHAPVSTLATETCEWWRTDRFWAWEGVMCCHGTCSHVWNYEHAMARLFPELERSVREMQDLGTGFRDDGMMGHRGEGSGYAADGHAGTILKSYREHQMSADAEFLKRNWLRIKKALEYLVQQDGNDDGLIENAQPNTYDVEFFGPNTFVGSLYLAALRAGEEMALEMGDAPFAARARKIVESGTRVSMERLYNGEYFTQIVDLKEHSQNQYADGCLADQMFGQGWAHQVGLGYIYPIDSVKSALRSVWKYNWAPDVEPQTEAHPPGRWFVSKGEPGLFICTWPKSQHLGPTSVAYRDEVWTGIEYQVAGHMVWEGLLDEAFAILRAVHERYQPARGRNPYNEIECGPHYARAMASWGVLLALCGYEYHGPKGHLGFAPRVTPEDFRAAFTAAEGWGTLAQKRGGNAQQNRIEVRWGRLRLRTLALSLPDGVVSPQVTVTVGGNPQNATHKVENGRLLVTFPDWVTVEQDHALEVTAR